jgi:hypothetical protein
MHQSDDPDDQEEMRTEEIPGVNILKYSPKAIPARAIAPGIPRPPRSILRENQPTDRKSGRGNDIRRRTIGSAVANSA